jgi:hypothetical protein
MLGDDPHARRRATVLTLRVSGGHVSHERDFAETESEIAAVIGAAATRAGGNLEIALKYVREWAAAQPGRETRIIQALHCKTPPLPLLREIVAHAIDALGPDEDAVGRLVNQYLESPDVRDRLDRELWDLMAEALMEWMWQVCAEWRAERT